MKVAAIIQARIGSTRLPGKVLMKVLGKTLLEYQVERIKRVELIDDIIIATTNSELDDPIVTFCEEKSIKYFRGSEQDVLSRYFEAAKKYKADVIVRLTSDCPLIDPTIINNIIDIFLKGEYDYVSNTIERTYPRGMDTEVFSFENLKKVNEIAVHDYQREHVTPLFYLNPERYKIFNLKNNTDLSKYRLTVDTKEDYELIKLILENLYRRNNHFSFHDVIEVMEVNQEWFNINSHIEQKKLLD